MAVEIHMVGGAVRDMLMGIEPKDIDYVVVGANHQYMIENGFSLIGKDFPVYIDINGDEYALARRERSTGDGYVDFTFEVDGVTLDQDLERRDLTINAIAIQKQDYDPNSYVVYDPFGGQDDIANKVLRPVSNAFMEDPVRVLRVARFRARYGADWKISPELHDMVYSMAKKGMLDGLQKDRIWKEMSRALMEPHPRLFFDTLLEMDALHKIFPDVYKLLTALESRKWHPEGNAYEHTMLVLSQAAKFGFDLDVRFACLVHDIGKGLTRFEHMPSHFGHDIKGSEMIEDFCRKYAVPSNIMKLSKFATRYHMYCHKVFTLNPKTYESMFSDCRGSSEYVEVLIKVGMCDERGRLGSENATVTQIEVFRDMLAAYNSVSFNAVFPNGETKVEKIKEGLRRARIKEMSVAMSNAKKESLG